MLIEFKVTNYRSIRAEQTLSMVASNYSDELPQNLISCDHVPGLKGTKLVKAVALYGANASGKSNIVAALRFFAEFVRDSATKLQPGAPTGAQPFKLDPACLTEPSKFEITAVIKGIRTVYGLELTRERVTSEYLAAYPKGRPQVWFERDWDEGRGKYEWSKSTTHFPHDIALRRKARENALFLSVAAQFDHQEARSVWDWFKSEFYFSNRQENLKDVASLLKDEILRAHILSALGRADFGISDAKFRKLQPEPEDPKYRQFTEHLEKAMAAVMEDVEPLRKAWEENRTTPIPELGHRGQDGVNTPMNFHSEESEGTRRFLFLLCEFYHHAKNGRVVLVDEIEASLHPILVREVISLFQKSEIFAGFDHQLIFTTHNPLLLDQTLLRRDQIWFTEKDQEGATRLYPLTDFKPRKDESLVKGYLSGRYGGIPFIPEGLKF